MRIIIGGRFNLLAALFLFVPFLLLAQAPSEITGRLKSRSGEPIRFGTLTLRNTVYGAAVDSTGSFRIQNVAPGYYTIQATAAGFSSIEKTITVTPGQNITADIELSEDNKLAEVTVFGRTATQETNRQSYNVTAVDAKRLHNTTLDLSHALDRVSGVRVREDGGVGSRVNFSLNGFTGKQVKFFLDGVPMDNFGSSFQINNIPINLAERIEVYKGVVPIWLGADALGGAVNIVTNTQARSYLDISYSFGSFNTHRTVINAGYTSRSGFTVQLNAFQNYSDNDYWVQVDVADINTGAYFRDQRVRRFHDNYHNETIIGNIGLIGKKYADQLLLGITLGKNYREIQTGARMVSVFGNYYTRGNTVMPHIRYQKDNLFIKGLNVRLTANYNLGEEQNVDTVYRRYNWFQQYKQYPGNGGERSRTLYRYQNNTGLATGNVSYQISKQHSVMLNNVFSSFDRIGHDPLLPDEAKYEQPQFLIKNVLGLGYKYDFDTRWSTSVFLKQFNQVTKYGESYSPDGAWGSTAYRTKSTDFSSLGYGIASSYFIKRNTQLKGSYERSYRMPDTYEVFGDQVNLDGNLTLKPEMSDNYNAGLSTSVALNKAHSLSFSGNFIFRNVRDFIRPTLNNNQTKQIMENRDRVTNTGVDGEIRYSYRNLFTAGANLTYQDIRNKTEYEPGQSTKSVLYGDRIPNMPFLYGNLDASVFIRDAFAKGNTISVGYNLLYVHAYYLYWPSLGKDKLDIPEQFCSDANVTYSMANGRYNLAFECRNMFDALLYDNFSLQKPSRAFNVKLRYFLTRKN